MHVVIIKKDYPLQISTYLNIAKDSIFFLNLSQRTNKLVLNYLTIKTIFLEIVKVMIILALSTFFCTICTLIVVAIAIVAIAIITTWLKKAPLEIELDPLYLKDKLIDDAISMLMSSTLLAHKICSTMKDQMG